MQTINVGSFIVDVMHKDIKNVHLSVYPPTGRVTISAPMHMGTELLRVYAISRIGWIKQQQKKLLNQAREPLKEYVSRESHYFKGKRYLLKTVITNGKSFVEVKHHKMVFNVKATASLETKVKILDSFYRNALNEIVPPFIEKWEKILHLSINEYGIKKMRTKWGTCNPKAKRIWLNIELAKKPLHCLEYIIVHEMIHLLERNHNDKFVSHLNRHLPNWKQIKQELNELPVGV
jgi:predicted metal-dependent hydrolase